ncbi:MAG TPA: LemA family protein [Chitinophagales bacterium]|nr:LemA family protein [Chitinophagales bacterium]
MKRFFLLAFVAFSAATLFSSCSYNKIVSNDENVKESWANVEAAYQERFDLVDNLVSTVKGYAEFERGTLTEVIQARANASGVTIKADEITPANIEKFEQAQAALSGSLSRLLVTVERYPDLKANANFMDLQAQLARLEQKINISRRDFNATIKTYNTSIRTFPAVVTARIFGFNEKEGFKSEAGAEKAPKVQF